MGCCIFFFMADYHLDLGLVGQRAAKGLLIFTMGVTVVWAAYFAPSLDELRKDREDRNASKKRQ